MVRFVGFGNGASTRLIFGLRCVAIGIGAWGLGCFTQNTNGNTHKENAESAPRNVTLATQDTKGKERSSKLSRRWRTCSRGGGRGGVARTLTTPPPPPPHPQAIPILLFIGTSSVYEHMHCLQTHALFTKTTSVFRNT